MSEAFLGWLLHDTHTYHPRAILLQRKAKTKKDCHSRFRSGQALHSDGLVPLSTIAIHTLPRVFNDTTLVFP